MAESLSLFAPWGESFATWDTCLWTSCWIVSGLVMWEQRFGWKKKQVGCWKGILAVKSLECQTKRLRDPAQKWYFLWRFSWYLSVSLTHFASLYDQQLPVLGPSWYNLDSTWMSLHCLLIHLPPSLPLEFLESQKNVLPISASPAAQ